MYASAPGTIVMATRAVAASTTPSRRPVIVRDRCEAIGTGRFEKFAVERFRVLGLPLRGLRRTTLSRVLLIVKARGQPGNAHRGICTDTVHNPASSSRRRSALRPSVRHRFTLV